MIALFSPDYPDQEFYTIVAIFMRLGYCATRDHDDAFDFAMAWQDRTWVDHQPRLAAIAKSRPVLNLACRDISKRRVEAVFGSVFGSSTFIDPTRFEGLCVRKYDENARGGSVIRCPVARPEAGFVYQRLIDTSTGGRMIEYRVPIVLGDIPVVYVQEKVVPVDTIKTEKLSLHISAAGAVFSDDERVRIGAFCREMGLDFGELDIVRANDDGRIYVLDANKTPGGFGMLNRMKWRPEQRRFAIDRLSAAFEAGILARLRNG